MLFHDNNFAQTKEADFRTCTQNIHIHTRAHSFGIVFTLFPILFFVSVCCLVCLSHWWIPFFPALNKPIFTQIYRFYYNSTQYFRWYIHINTNTVFFSLCALFSRNSEFVCWLLNMNMPVRAVPLNTIDIFTYPACVPYEHTTLNAYVS